MTLHEQIRELIKDAMRAKDAVRLDTLRGVLSACTNELVAKGRKPQEMLSDEEALVVITRLAKQRKDSIEQYTTGNRLDLVSEESAQLAVLQEFLPTLMSEDEVTNIVKEKISSIGTDVKKGMVMAEIMRELKGKADGALVKKVVDSLIE
ncbi:MAG: GatB/YqeY domain-containing protein [Minisyncoccia bacterium]